MKAISSVNENDTKHITSPTHITQNQIYHILLTFFDVIHVVHFLKASHVERKTGCIDRQILGLSRRREMKTWFGQQ